MVIEFLDPSNAPADSTALAPRHRGSLEGARVGIVWNGRPNGDGVLKQVANRISSKYGVTIVDFQKKPLIGNLAPKEIFQGFIEKPVDYVLAGVGD